MTSTSTSMTQDWPSWAKCIGCWDEVKATAPLDHYGDEAEFIVLPCFHVLCASGPCFDAVFGQPSQGKVRCPTCAIAFPVTMETQSMRIKAMDFVAVKEAPKLCTLCIRMGNAVAFCPECDRFLCENCAEHHGFAVTTASHTLADMDLFPPPKEPEMCSRHPGNELNGYCRDCDVVVCGVCQGNHSNCQICSVEEAIAFMTRSVGEFSSIIGNQLEELRKVQVAVNSKIGRLMTTEKDYLMKEAQLMLTVLISKLYSREHQLRSEIRNLTQESAGLLRLKEKECDMKSQSVLQYEQFVQSLVTMAAEGGEDVVRREGFFKAFRLAKRFLPEQLKILSKFNRSYFELGHHFRVDKSGYHVVEKELPKFCSISYNHAPNTKRSGDIVVTRQRGRGGGQNEPTPIIISAESLAPPTPTRQPGPRKPQLPKKVNPLTLNSPYKPVGRPRPKKPILERDPLALGDSDEELHHELSIEAVEIEETSPKEKRVVIETAVEPQEEVLDFDLDSEESLKRLKLLGRVGNTDAGDVGDAKVKQVNRVKVTKKMPLDVRPLRPQIAIDPNNQEAVSMYQVMCHGMQIMGCGRGLIIGNDSDNEEEDEVDRVEEPVAMETAPQLQESLVPTELEQTLGEMAEEFKKEQTEVRPKKSSRKSQLESIRNESTILFEDDLVGGEASETGGGSGGRGGRKSPRKRKKSGASSLLGVAMDIKETGGPTPAPRLPGKREIKRKILDPEFVSPDAKKKESPPIKRKRGSRKKLSLDPLKTSEDSDHDDYCGICRDGGDDLICCESCPRVIHPLCHIPALSGIPEGSFFCNFCKTKEAASDPAQQPEKHVRTVSSKGIHGDEKEFFKACKFLCEIFKWENELEFRVFVEGIKNESSSESETPLYKIRKRLALNEPSPFANAKEMLDELEKLFQTHSESLKSRKSSPEFERLKQFDKKFTELVSDYYPGFERGK